MSREIKFRAWDGKRMLTGSEDVIPVLLCWEGKAYPLYNTQDESGDYTAHADWEDEAWGEGVTLMQFTGLTDSKGVEIYEGDIMRHPEFVAGGPVVVRYSVDAASFTLNGWDGFKTDFTEGTVIGNIHQHKHLLNNE